MWASENMSESSAVRFPRHATVSTSSLDDVLCVVPNSKKESIRSSPSYHLTTKDPPERLWISSLDLSMEWLDGVIVLIIELLTALFGPAIARAAPFGPRAHPRRAADDDAGSNSSSDNRKQRAGYGAPPAPKAPADPFTVLKLPPKGEGVTPADVKKAYRKLAMRYHPDKVSQHGLDPKDAEQKMKEVQSRWQLHLPCVQPHLAHASFPTFRRLDRSPQGGVSALC